MQLGARGGDVGPDVTSTSKPGTATVTVLPYAFTRLAVAPALTGSIEAQSLTHVTFPAGCAPVVGLHRRPVEPSFPKLKAPLKGGRR